MNNVSLIGVAHGNESKEINGECTTVLGPESDAYFKEIIFPSFEKKSTLLIVEGEYRNDIISSDHRLYEKKVKNISNELLASDYGPDILCADTRSPNNTKKVIEFYRANQIVEAWIGENIAFIKRPPDTYEEMREMILQGKALVPSIIFRSRPTDSIKHLSLKLLNGHKGMEDHMLAQAKRYHTKYDQVIIITGLAHTFEMYRKSNLPYHIFLDPPETIIKVQTLFLSILIGNIALRAVLEFKPKY